MPHRRRSVGLLLLLLIVGTAAAAAKKRKKKAPPPDAATKTAMTHHQQGVMAHVQGDPDGAVSAFGRAIEAKPDFAYAYYRMGFVMEEVRKSTSSSAKEGAAGDGKRPPRKKPVKANPYDDAAAPAAFRAALAIDPSDEMAHIALGHALHDRARHGEAAAVFQGVTASVNPRSAQAYWGLGKVRADGIDEWDSDPDDPNDPSHCYEQAAKLQPAEFKPDGTRVRRVEPMTPEREERRDEEARERRQRVLQELKDGTRTMNVAGEADELRTS